MSNDKRKLFEELVEEVRLSQEATARFDQAVGDALGLNRTDMRCLEVIEREGPISAGRLAEATGLTAGAMTTALDRLERSGHARRVHDPGDRRRVLVELTPEARGHGDHFWAAHQAHAEDLYRRYTAEQIRLLLDFVRAGRMLNEREAIALEARNRAAERD